MSPSLVGPALIHDIAVAHRDHLLDTESVRPHLAAMLERPVDLVEIRRVKYRVGQSLRVLYEAHGDAAPALVSARTFPALPRPRNGATRWDRFDALAWVFPRDRKIGALREIVERSGDLDGSIGRHDTLVLEAYTPEKAATFRITDRTAARPTADRHVKVMEPRAFQGAELRAETLPGLLHRAGIATPHLVGSEPRLGTLVWTHLDGAPTTTSLEDCRAVGRLLARLHGIAPPPELPRHDRSTTAALKSAVETISAVRPDAAEPAQQLWATLEDRRQDRLPTALLHGDVHPKNILVDGHTAGVIDLDQAVAGPGAADIASLIAKLRELGAPASSTDALVASYVREGGTVEPGELAWHTAAAVLGERALRAVTRLRSEVLPHLSPLLTRALDTLRSAQ